MNVGSGADGEITFLDAISLMSFFIGLQNLDLNVTQEDAQKLQKQTDANTSLILDEVHKHLERQDEKIDMILKRLEELQNGIKRDL